ncbi:MAG: helix-turn-helix domain-containing protein [Acidimicrobiales bacterium]
MKRVVTYEWKLAEFMARNGMHNSTDLASHLRERDINLSASQIYRLVTQQPERLSLPILAALCDIFNCTAADLLVVNAQDQQTRRRTAGGGVDLNNQARPRRARVIDNER